MYAGANLATALEHLLTRYLLDLPYKVPALLSRERTRWCGPASASAWWP